MIEDMEPPSYILDNSYVHNTQNNNFDIADFLCDSGVHPNESRDQCNLSEDSCNRSDCTDGYYGYQSSGDYIDPPSEYCNDNVPYDTDSLKYSCNPSDRSGCTVDDDGKVKAISVRQDHSAQISQRPMNDSCGKGVKMEESPEFLRWTSRHPENWSPQEVLDWLFFAAEKHNLDCTHLHAENFRSVAGADLCKMTLDDFLLHEPNYGKLFYDMFRNLCDGLHFSQPNDSHSQDCLEYDDVTRNSPLRPTLHNMNSDPGPMNQSYIPDLSSKPEMKMEHMSDHVMNDHMMYDIQQLTKYNYQMPMSHLLQAQSMKHHPFHTHPHPHHMSPYEQYPPHCMYSDFGAMHRMPPPPCHIPEDHMVPQPIRRRPGRPRIKSLPSEEEAARDKKAKNQHLWEFIYEILMNPLYNPQYLRWENQREGVFRFVQSEAVAQLWGGLKNNENMTYEKLSRAMRHYYKRGILERVEGRRLVYKFSRIAMERVREKRYSV
ncbi:hypothetical protein FSP39_024646 [Pinctada imbricata]|uniref:Uncharacterized protein n=1 Tax=Pinctada imbricata TaxID=66713 RepID=A0AA89C3A4_PINIB|nr:hypothetical protein FSP39_024646 [Pinctada imbricata]